MSVASRSAPDWPLPDPGARLEVLLIEDSVLDAQLIEAELAEAGFAFRLTRVDDHEGLSGALAGTRYDLILSDYNVPGFSGLAALTAARLASPETPFLFVSGALGEDRAIDLLKRGATDYVLKDRLDRLGPSVQRALREAREREGLRRAELERDRQMQLAQAERARLHALFMQAPMASCLVSGPQHEIVLANPLYRALLRSPAEPVGRRYADVTPRWLGEPHLALLDRAFVSGEIQTVCEVAVPAPAACAEARTRYFSFAFQPTRDAADCIDSVLIQAFEVTEAVTSRQRVEQLAAELQEREARARALIASLVEGVLVLDPSGTVVQCNASAEQLLGTAPDTLLGRAITDPAWETQDEEGSPYVPEQFPAMTALRTRTVQAGRVLNIRRGDGERVWLSVNARPLDDATGGVVTSFFDVTERKAFEAEMKSRAELEQLLAGIVSHDLRNPLGAIQLSAQILLRQANGNESASKHLLRILSSTDRASRLIRDLLDFTAARLGSGIRVVRSDLDFHALARDTVDEIRAAWPGREIQLLHEGDGSGSWDSDRMAQVIQNLATNALRYSPPETAVHIRTRGEGPQLVLEVRNMGRPIPPELIPHLFKALKRGTEEIDRQSRSVGLGLFIVQQVVKSHGGNVSVCSTAEDGTTFTVQLPRA
jgi:PAS domain S-box-containing protein